MKRFSLYILIILIILIISPVVVSAEFELLYSAFNAAGSYASSEYEGAADDSVPSSAFPVDLTFKYSFFLPKSWLFKGSILARYHNLSHFQSVSIVDPGGSTLYDQAIFSSKVYSGGLGLSLVLPSTSLYLSTDFNLGYYSGYFFSGLPTLPSNSFGNTMMLWSTIGVGLDLSFADLKFDVALFPRLQTVTFNFRLGVKLGSQKPIARKYSLLLEKYKNPLKAHLITYDNDRYKEIKKLYGDKDLLPVVKVHGMDGLYSSIKRNGDTAFKILESISKKHEFLLSYLSKERPFDVKRYYNKYGVLFFADLKQNLAMYKRYGNDFDAFFVRKTGYKVKQVVQTKDVKSDIDEEDKIPKGTQNPNAVAVVIGNENYTKVDKVRWAHKDALSMRRYLIKTFGFDNGRILFYKDATKSDMEVAFGNDKGLPGKLHLRVKPDSDVFIYYSGHGAPDMASEKKDAFILPVNSDPHFLKLSAYKLSTLYDNLKKLKCRSITVVLDSCFSGRSETGSHIKGAKALVPADVKPKEKDINFSVITSSRGNEISSAYDKQGHSLFTYYFLKRISSIKKDRQYTIGSILPFVSDRVSSKAGEMNRQQTPEMFGSKNTISFRVK